MIPSCVCLPSNTSTPPKFHDVIVILHLLPILSFLSYYIQQAHPSFAPSGLLFKFTLSAPNALCVPPPAAPGPFVVFICVSGIAFAIAVKTSCTFFPVFALVSKNSNPSSSAYSRPSFVEIFLASPFSSSAASAPSIPSSPLGAFTVDSAFSSEEEVRSSLLPTRAMTMPGEAWRWSSATQCFAFTREVGLVRS